MSIAQLIQAGDRIAATTFNVGYDQGQRWSFFDRSTHALTVGAECDCSSSCGAIAVLGGYPVDLSDPFSTANLVSRYVAAGFTRTDVSGWDQARLFAALRAGDTLRGEGHVVFVLGDGRWWSAESDERGQASGGQAGDQTGREAYVRAPYMRSRGWTDLLRAPADAVTLTATTATTLAVDGQFGPLTVRALQRLLRVPVDGVYGPQTKRALQSWLGVAVDGIVGPKTVRALQARVGASVDGDWGPKTTRALQAWLNGQVSL